MVKEWTENKWKRSSFERPTESLAPESWLKTLHSRRRRNKKIQFTNVCKNVFISKTQKGLFQFRLLLCKYEHNVSVFSYIHEQIVTRISITTLDF